MKVKFYVAMALVLVGLFVAAAWRTSDMLDDDQNASTNRYPTLSAKECAVRFETLKKVLAGQPSTWREYFRTLGAANELEGAARKAYANLPRNAPQEDAFILKTIPIDIPQMITRYQFANPALEHTVGNPAFEAARAEFERTHKELSDENPALPTGIHVGLWWLAFQVVGALFAFVHYCIRIKDKGMKIWLELIGNPAFVCAVPFWEIGLFRYPKKVSVGAQLRRLQQWATFFLSSAIPCFAAGASGTACKKDPTPVRWSMSTTPMSQYVGLDGAVFYPYPVVQTTATVGVPCGFSFNVWNSEPLNHWGLAKNYGREVDVSLLWGKSFHGIDVGLAGTYLDVNPVFQLPRGDVFQLAQRVSRNIPLGKKHGIAPYAWFREAMPVRGATPVGGWFVHGGFVLSDSFGAHFANNATLDALHDSGAFGYKPRVIGRFLDTPSWQIGKRWSLQMPLIVTEPLSRTPGDSRTLHASGGLGLGFSF